MSTRERPLSLISDESLVRIAEENEALHTRIKVMERRIVQLETERAEERTSIAGRKLWDRITEIEDLVGGLLPLLGQVREALYGKRTLIEESMDRINNTLARYADLPNRAEFQALLERVDGLAAREQL